MDFKDKVVLVTGAAGALGQKVAVAFGRAGARRVLVDSNGKGMRDVFGSDGADHILLEADLLDLAATQAAVKAAIAKMGKIDILCNIAGGFRMGPAVHETPDDMWRLMIDLNVNSMLNACRAVVPGMLAAGSGKIVNVGAGAAQKGGANMGAYAASKSAVIRYTESMAAELREKNINVNCVLPSIIDTPANRADMPKADYKRWVAPASLAQVILFLASSGARDVHGAAIPVVGLS